MTKKLNQQNHATAYYSKEHLEFYPMWNIHLTNQEAKVFARKIIKHFKYPKKIELHFNANRKGSGVAFLEESKIKLADRPTVGLLSHELAHIISNQTHTKECYLLMRKIIKYSEKKNYWRMNKNET